jgi:hypothetical protein
MLYKSVLLIGIIFGFGNAQEAISDTTAAGDSTSASMPCAIPLKNGNLGQAADCFSGISSQWAHLSLQLSQTADSMQRVIDDQQFRENTKNFLISTLLGAASAMEAGAARTMSTQFGGTYTYHEYRYYPGKQKYTLDATTVNLLRKNASDALNYSDTYAMIADELLKAINTNDASRLSYYTSPLVKDAVKFDKIGVISGYNSSDTSTFLYKSKSSYYAHEIGGFTALYELVATPILAAAIGGCAALCNTLFQTPKENGRVFWNWAGWSAAYIGGIGLLVIPFSINEPVACKVVKVNDKTMNIKKINLIPLGNGGSYIIIL